ncbi:hypothetical protein BRY73_05715 [Ochrobactrum sp. P6BS-III]|nr:hypothetical protein BRY73_05715 [Ochrobactrum sp. P6BS-III]
MGSSITEHIPKSVKRFSEKMCAEINFRAPICFQIEKRSLESTNCAVVADCHHAVVFSFIIDNQ